MREKLKILREDFQELKAEFDEGLERFRVKYYHEFALSVFSFGLLGIYLLYVWSRLPILQVHANTTFPYNLAQALYFLDLAGIFFAFNPFFDILSSIMLFGGCLWGVLKLFKHSLVKLSELELLPISERIKEIEKEGEEVDNEKTSSHRNNASL